MNIYYVYSINTPRVGGLSPAQIVFEHPLPVLYTYTSFDSKWTKLDDEYDEKVSKSKLMTEEYYSWKSKILRPLKVNAEVRLQNPLTKIWDRVGCIVGVRRTRDYFIKLPCGKVMWRNRKFIRPTIAMKVPKN